MRVRYEKAQLQHAFSIAGKVDSPSEALIVSIASYFYDLTTPAADEPGVGHMVENVASAWPTEEKAENTFPLGQTVRLYGGQTPFTTPAAVPLSRECGRG